jgi:triacylglycerol lipase
MSTIKEDAAIVTGHQPDTIPNQAASPVENKSTKDTVSASNTVQNPSSAIATRSLAEQSHFFALCSNYAYLNEKEGKEKFKALGFDAEFIDVKGSQAYFLKNEQDLIVVCRGTQPTEFSDITADLKVRMVASSTGRGKVHHGFKHSVDNIWPVLKPKLEKYGKTRTIWCTGHSLGAAMATLVGFYLRRNPDIPDTEAIFTYGSPKVGNDQYIAMMHELDIKHYRFVNNADVVTRVPSWPYHHYKDMYYMNHWGNIRPMTWSQVFKDRLRGFFKGLKKGQINFFVNHSITKYCANLEYWARGEERHQGKI